MVFLNEYRIAKVMLCMICSRTRRCEVVLHIDGDGVNRGAPG